jgi:hypothetical protein
MLLSLRKPDWSMSMMFPICNYGLEVRVLQVDFMEQFGSSTGRRELGVGTPSFFGGKTTWARLMLPRSAQLR